MTVVAKFCDPLYFYDPVEVLDPFRIIACSVPSEVKVYEMLHVFRELVFSDMQRFFMLRGQDRLRPITGVCLREGHEISLQQERP
ncbi:hypothetical protein ARMSODRAFT_955887 [Armillaria solidipes]|uniref:Uncharacterized protein n=1 Tax=Armillaria solidipes TaxID=1076256 RepID=A0A2H3C514_9AGAR|nr:hypothetical protein ARMSODRAFT_955887 [Armillaria solidipes]